MLDIASENNLKLNKEKCQFGVNQLIFLGDLLTDHGIQADESKVSPGEQIRCTKVPRNGDISSKWIPSRSQKSAPLRILLNKETEWQWGPEQEASWMTLKEILSSKPVLQYYDPQKPIKISSDASKDGLGAVLLQLHGNDWKPVAYASRAMLDAETRYAQIEKELLGIAYACERFHQFIYGAKVFAETDHKPLVNIFQKSLADCPLRIQRPLLKLQRYDLQVSYTPGKFLFTADALSRAQSQTKLRQQVPTAWNKLLRTSIWLLKRCQYPTLG